MPPKGLRLYVRPATAADAAMLEQFVADAGASFHADDAAIDFVAKLIGDTAAFARTRRSGSDLALEQLVVAPHLRGKRVGTVLLSEIAAWGAANGVTRLTLAENVLPTEFVSQAGFIRRADSFVKSIRE